MTDNEIIKAWDILAKFDFFGGQRAGRELWNEKPFDVQNEDIKNFSEDVKILKDLINRQRAEIENYKSALQKIEPLAQELKGDIKELVEIARAEAIKEVLEKVIDLINEADDVNPVSEWQIRNLVKEMTEATE